MHPRCVRLAAAAGMLVLLASSSAFAADWYVDAAAPAGGDGSKAKPFGTIGAALAGLNRGDTVWLATGTYDEVVNLAKLPGTGTTTFRALPGATPVIDGTSGSAAAGFVVQTAVPDMTFEDLTIENAKSGALGIQFYYADGGRVIHCVTKNMSSNAVTFYYSNQGTVTGSTCQGNIAGRKTTGTVVENNEVYGSGAEGIGLYDGSTQCTVGAQRHSRQLLGQPLPRQHKPLDVRRESHLRDRPGQRSRGHRDLRRRTLQRSAGAGELVQHDHQQRGRGPQSRDRILVFG